MVALHLHRDGAARRVAADGEDDRGMDAGRRLARVAATWTIPSATSRHVSSRLRPAPTPELGEFWGGAVGYFSYDVVRAIEHLPDAPPRTIDAPDACFVFTKSLVIIDNLRGQARLVATVEVDDERARRGVAPRAL